LIPNHPPRSIFFSGRRKPIACAAVCRPSRFLCFHGGRHITTVSSPSRLRISSPPSRLRDSSSRSCPLSWGRIARGVVVRPRVSSSRVPCACPARGDLERPRESSSCVPCPLPPVALHPCTLHVIIFSTRGDLEFSSSVSAETILGYFQSRW